MVPPPVPEGQPRQTLKGLFFDPESWDGSDVFTPEDTGFVFVVEGAKSALVKAKVKKLNVQCLIDFLWP